jgi:branched-chain amino acid transport system permease protein
VKFLSYNAHYAKVIVFSVSGMIAGVAGALQAISNEAANYSLFAGTVSAQVVLQAFVGGSTVFFGPVIGATVFTLFSFLVSDLTRSWLFYQGLIFVLVMLYAPKGIGGVIDQHIRNRHQLDWAKMSGPYLAALGGGLLIVAGTVFLTESAEVLFGQDYEMAREAVIDGLPSYELFGFSWNPINPLTWALPLILLSGGIFILIHARRLIDQHWAQGNKDRSVLNATSGSTGTAGGA